MPAVRDTGDFLPPLDSLEPRRLEVAPLIARQPEAGIAKRQQQYTGGGDPSIIPQYYNMSGPAPGTVVGIVLGSVAGFILIVWLLYSLTNGNAGGVGGGAHIAGEEEIVVRRRRNSNSHRSSRRSTHAEMRQHSRSPRRSTTIVEERRVPVARTRSRSIVVEERRRVPGDDMVEVIEEHDEYRTRRGGRRSGGYR